MKKYLVALIVLGTVIALVVGGCANLRFIRGTGEIVKTNYDFKDFTEIEASNAFVLDVVQSNAFSVEVSTRENLVPYLEVTQTGRTVRLTFKPGSYTNTDINARVTLPSLNRLNLSGASRATVTGFKSAQSLAMDVSGASRAEIDMGTGAANLKVSGAGRISGKLASQDTRIDVSGASRCELQGSGGKLNIQVSGASRGELADFPVQQADLEVSGASHAAVRTDGQLSVDVSGASSVDYYGNPSLSHANVTGASRLNKK